MPLSSIRCVAPATTVKSSISLTEAQDAYALSLVQGGRYPSLSAVLRRGLDLLREDTEARDTELAALRAILEERRAGRFISLAEGRVRTARMIAAKKVALGVSD